jgi:toxin HigB-1
MIITFRNKKLGKLVKDERKLVKEFGKLRAGKLQIRLEQISFANTLEDLRYMPGNYHELTGNRKGQITCDLDQPFRLIFNPHLDQNSLGTAGKLKWSGIKGIEIIEIMDYH